MADQARQNSRPPRVGRDGPTLFDGQLQTFSITRVFADKGFAFGESPEGKEIFIHRTGSFEDPTQFDRLEPGDVVRCRVCNTAKGWRAFDAELV